jgi:RNA polymerase sigma factor (sigma-70 family)
MRIELDTASDFDLLRLSHVDEDAFAVFYRRYERLVAGWLMRRTGRSELAADLTAEVFAAAYLAAPRFREGPGPAGAWLLGIARNKLLRSLRRDRAEASARTRLAIGEIDFSEQSLASLEALQDGPAIELLDDLPEDQREAIRAHVIDELDYSELAVRSNVSPAAVRQRVSRGLATLRRRLNHQGGNT